MVIGALALREFAAAKAGGRVTGTRGALTTVLAQPFGLDAAARGRCWASGSTPPGASFKVLLRSRPPGQQLARPCDPCELRGSRVLHAVLGLQAFRLYRGLSAASGTSEREVATEALQWPLGDWLVVLAGLGLIGFAVQQLYAAITCRLERNLDVEEMREAGEWAVGLSRFGVAARAVVFALLGWAIVVAGWFRYSSEVGTTASSFRTLAAQPGGLGRWLLGVTAAGFVAYGFYEIIHARYLHIRRVR